MMFQERKIPIHQPAPLANIMKRRTGRQSAGKARHSSFGGSPPYDSIGIKGFSGERQKLKRWLRMSSSLICSMLESLLSLATELLRIQLALDS